jgi:hypothetical protein
MSVVHTHCIAMWHVACGIVTCVVALLLVWLIYVCIFVYVCVFVCVFLSLRHVNVHLCCAAEWCPTRCQFDCRSVTQMTEDTWGSCRIELVSVSGKTVCVSWYANQQLCDVVCMVHLGYGASWVALCII